MKADFILAFVFVLLGMMSVLPLIVVTLANIDGIGFEKVSSLFKKHDSVILSLGTIFLISGLGLFTTNLASKWADVRERSNRSVQAILKLSEFRQDWIKEMRDDIAELIQLSFQGEPECFDRLVSLSTKIKMRLNLDEELALNVLTKMNELSESVRKKDSDLLAASVSDLTEAAGLYLKNEWRELKRRVRLSQNPTELIDEEIW